MRSGTATRGVSRGARGYKSKRLRHDDFESSALFLGASREKRKDPARVKKLIGSTVNGVSSGGASHSGNVRRVVTSSVSRRSRVSRVCNVEKNNDDDDDDDSSKR